MISTLTRYMISKSTRYKPLFEAVVGRHASGRDGMILMWQSSQCWSPAWDGRISSSLSTPGHRVSQDKKINVSPQNIIECGIWIMTIWHAWLTLRVRKIYNLNIGEKMRKHCLCIFYLGNRCDHPMSLRWDHFLLQVPTLAVCIVLYAYPKKYWRKVIVIVESTLVRKPWKICHGKKSCKIISNGRNIINQF